MGYPVVKQKKRKKIKDTLKMKEKYRNDKNVANDLGLALVLLGQIEQLRRDHLLRQNNIINDGT